MGRSTAAAPGPASDIADVGVHQPALQRVEPQRRILAPNAPLRDDRAAFAPEHARILHSRDAEALQRHFVRDLADPRPDLGPAPRMRVRGTRWRGRLGRHRGSEAWRRQQARPEHEGGETTRDHGSLHGGSWGAAHGIASLPDACALSSRAAVRLGGGTHTWSFGYASRHTKPWRQVSGPQGPPPGWRRE